MNAFLQSRKVRYAVIQLSTAPDPPERIVLAYNDEATLRALIAEPSIVGLGFGCREEAARTEHLPLENAVPPAPANKSESTPVGQDERHTHGSQAAGWLSFLSLRRTASGIVQFAFAAAICIFYSKNIVSATVRSVLAVSI